MKKILVVEDDNTIHKLIEETLKKENYLVKNAYSGTEALTIIKNDNIYLKRKEVLFFMSLKAGIVGLPNVGKSTLFNAITNSHVEAANYPFATINPNSGIAELNDVRFDKLVDIFHPKKEVRAVFEFIDIAGLVKGASKGEGLGNQFLANIRLCDAICHVVRCFDSSEIIHVDGNVDPQRDIDIINLLKSNFDIDDCGMWHQKPILAALAMARY